MGVVLIIIIVIFLCWPMIIRWLQRFMARRAEDMVRRMAGMPSRKEEERRRRRQEKQTGSTRERYSSSGQARHHRADGGGLRAMREYAEDVAFTEIKEYSSSEFTDDNLKTRQRRIYREEQVSDAEFVEIKN